MIRTAVVGLALIALTAAATPKPAPAGAPKSSAKAPAPVTVADAPADEYFGPFKYSAISTRTKIDSLGRSYRERWQDDGSIVHDAGLVQSSLEAWAKKYPKDRWLAPTAFHLAQLYMEVQTQDARNHARAMFQYVAQNFPKTPQAHLARARLAQGFPPLHDEPPVSPTPSPYGPSSASSPQPAGVGTDAASSPAPAAHPETTPAPAATAVPASTPAPKPAASPAPSARPVKALFGKPASTPTATPAPAPQNTATPAPAASAKPA